MPYLLLLAGVLLFTSIKGKTALYNELTIQPDPQSFKNFKFGLTGGTFQITILLNNPTPYSLRIDGINGNLLSEKNIIGSYKIDNSFLIKPNQKTPVVVECTAQSLNIIKQIYSIIKTKSIGGLNTSGFINTSIGRFPFENNLTKGINFNFKK